MADQKSPRYLRSVAWQAVLRRLRAEYPDEHKALLARVRGDRNPTQSAGALLRQQHPERTAELYREEVAARGLPAPVARPGRWPT